jgi:hypothetical protein
MTPRRRLGIGVAISLLTVGIVCWSVPELRPLVYITVRAAHFAIHPAPARCKQRAIEFQAKVRAIEKDAKSSLKIGTNKGDVVQFFAAEALLPTFDQIGSQGEATGTLRFKGLAECENFACGDDSAAIQVRVRVDAAGTVLSDPRVTGIYTNCL